MNIGNYIYIVYRITDGIIKRISLEFRWLLNIFQIRLTVLNIHKKYFKILFLYEWLRKIFNIYANSKK